MPERCPLCRAPGALAVAAPRARAMLSDGAPCGLGLARRHCRACGAGWLPARAAARLPPRLFGRRYALGGAPPGAADRARAAAYAARIVALWRGAPPGSVLDVGCGNGALLAALAARWPEARLAGVEPAPRPAAAARAAGIEVVPALRRGRRAALVVSVNVVEHTADPVGFLAALRRAVAPGGTAILLCPDGSTPWLELLMADHRWSLTPAALQHAAGAAGLRLLAADPAPGGIQAARLRPARRGTPPRRRAWHPVQPRRRYLAAWRALDPALAARLGGARRLVGFGAGEAARLLRLHAPSVWARLALLAADDPAGAGDPGRPVVTPAALRPGEDAVLLATRPAAQPGLAARLAGLGHRVIRWDDLVPR